MLVPIADVTTTLEEASREMTGMGLAASPPGAATVKFLLLYAAMLPSRVLAPTETTLRQLAGNVLLMLAEASLPAAAIRMAPIAEAWLMADCK
jgi:hypothetical protein